MLGFIFLWSGPIVDIPAGWQLCDGTNDTPDLRNKFVLGAGDTYAVNEVGGDWDHTHEFTSDGHPHDMGGAKQLLTGYDYGRLFSNETAAGITDTGNTSIPYYALAYIGWVGQ